MPESVRAFLQSAHEYGFWPLLVALLSAAMRRLLGYDGTAREVGVTVLAALVMAAWVAPGIAEYLELGARGTASLSVMLGMIARPLIEGTMRAAKAWKDDPWRFRK